MYHSTILKNINTSPKWRLWIWGCLSSKTFAILANGSSKGWVKVSGGLRKGNPLSSFLFTIAVDVLSRIVARAEDRFRRLLGREGQDKGVTPSICK